MTVEDHQLYSLLTLTLIGNFKIKKNYLFPFKLNQKNILCFNDVVSHCPYLRRYLNVSEKASQEHFDRVIHDNPQHVNQFFVKKFEIYVKVEIEGKNKCTPEHGGWYWYRYEWQHRGTVHAHGMGRKGDAPDTYLLADQAIERQRLLDLKKPAYTEEELAIIIRGADAEKQLCDFHDEFICTDSTIPYDEWLPPSHREPRQPHPAAVKECDVAEENRVQDDQDLTFMLQRHLCGQFCINKQNVCKLKYPRELNEKTKFSITRLIFCLLKLLFSYYLNSKINRKN